MAAGESVICVYVCRRAGQRELQAHCCLQVHAMIRGRRNPRRGEDDGCA